MRLPLGTLPHSNGCSCDGGSIIVAAHGLSSSEEKKINQSDGDQDPCTFGQTADAGKFRLRVLSYHHLSKYFAAAPGRYL